MSLIFFVVVSSISYAVSASSLSSELSNCNFTVTIKQQLEKDGFHRHLTYAVDISIDGYKDNLVTVVWPYDDCFISLHQSLPAGLYASLDELDELSRARKLTALTKQTNVELPAHNAERNMAYVFKKLSGPKALLWLPVHARYHKAKPYGGYVQNKIEGPHMYMRCPAEKLDKCEKPQLSPARFLCTIYSKQKCIWKKIPFKLINKVPIVWRTPVGDLHHYYPVAIVTALAVALGSIYLMMTIHSSKFIREKTNRSAPPTPRDRGDGPIPPHPQ